MSSKKEKSEFPVISFFRTIVQLLSFIIINFIALETIFNIDLSIFKEYTLSYPFLQTPRDAWTNGAGMLEFILFSLGRGEFPYFLVGLLFLILLTTSRFFCGWICPVGFFEDLVSNLPRRPRKMKIETDKGLKKIKFWIVSAVALILIALGIVKNINFTIWVDWSTVIGGFMDRPLASFSLSEFLFYTIPEGIKQAWQDLNTDFLFGNVWKSLSFVFYIIIIVVSAYYPRFYCRSLCPFGGVAAFISEYSFIRFGRNPVKCVGRRDCGICEKVCPMQVRILDEPFNGFSGKGECIMCGRCKEACPYDAIFLKLL
ncbi:MAG: 4Fe-4S binding protein [Promethearchaeota archaeon]